MRYLIILMVLYGVILTILAAHAIQCYGFMEVVAAYIQTLVSE